MNSRYNDLLSWLSPSGAFYPVQGTTHNDDAPELVLNLQRNTNTPLNRTQARELLLTNGWMRIAFLNRVLYANNPFVMPNHNQKYELIDLAHARDDVKQIKYDNNKTSRTIWSSDEEL